MNSEFVSIIAEELSIPRKSVNATVKLLEDGATIPFISRYRKEATGALDENAIHNIERRYRSLEALEKRKEAILASMEEQGKLTDDLRKRIEETREASTLEDIYMPFRPKRRTRAMIAAEKGLEPLARMIMSQNLDSLDKAVKKFVKGDVADAAAAVDGASDIIAEWISDSEKARSIVRARYMRNAVITSKVISGKEEDGRTYENYFDYTSPLRMCTSHRLLAVLRGQKEGILKVNVSIDDDEMIERLTRMFLRSTASDEVAAVIRSTVRDSYRRLIKPSIETEIMNAAKGKADDSAIAIFADNVRQVLMASPLVGKRVLAVDPGFKNGCKIAALDSQGNVLYTDQIFPNAPVNDFHGAAFKVCSIIDRFEVDVIALGNGTASRETENFLNQLRYPRPVRIYIVNESGASIYSTSEVGVREFPDLKDLDRGAISLGRRLIDPMAELVKIEPKHIGVGQYQHDVDQTKLRDALDFTVGSCVNAVGVNVNTASRELLSYVSGIGPTLAANIVSYRAENGDFTSRRELLNVSRMGEKAFQQCAGFLRIPGAHNILDNTGVHPERYDLVEAIASDRGTTVDALVKDPKTLQSLDLSPYVTKDVGLPTLTDIVLELEKPGRDPRAVDEEPVEFDTGIHDIRDLHAGMELQGVVNNITAFGCFVDLGIHENGLIHISQLADRFVSSPLEVVQMNQKVRVRVMDVDYMRGRIALTMKDVSQLPQA
ncbi:Tex family protein [Muribaculum sp.]|uniref:Tex family protein n=1 Tax=Muribaculum sp. TaxID=1918611 RepID=UPI0023C5BAE1|nr:Tex family protein [Muribaculum sp.]MDE5705074.1 RNA-binding transcriptional accessory protein [Muribaculum sp.]